MRTHSHLLNNSVDGRTYRVILGIVYAPLVLLVLAGALFALT